MPVELDDDVRRVESPTGQLAQGDPRKHERVLGGVLAAFRTRQTRSANHVGHRKVVRLTTVVLALPQQPLRFRGKRRLLPRLTFGRLWRCLPRFDTATRKDRLAMTTAFAIGPAYQHVGT